MRLHQLEKRKGVIAGKAGVPEVVGNIGAPEESLRVRVLLLEEGWLYLDHNHELAGEDLLFEIKLVSVD